MGKTLERKVGSIEVDRSLEAGYPVSAGEQAGVYIERLRSLKRNYESGRLSTDLTSAELSRIDEEFERRFSERVSKELEDEYLDLYYNIYLGCNEEMELARERSGLTLQSIKGL